MEKVGKCNALIISGIGAEKQEGAFEYSLYIQSQ